MQRTRRPAASREELAQGRALLEAVVAAPDDDLPRWAYADWLEERGRLSRAEFIRLGLRAAADPSAYGPRLPRSGFVRFRAPGARDTYTPWRPQWCQWAAYRRGFPETIRCSLLDWLRHGPRAVKEHPLTRIQVSDRLAAEVQGGLWVWTTDALHFRQGWAVGSDGQPFLPLESTAHYLPRPVWTLLRGAHCVLTRQKCYRSRQAAGDALAEALPRWARLKPKRGVA